MLLNGNEIQESGIHFCNVPEITASIEGTDINGNSIEIKFMQSGSDYKTLKCLENMLFPDPPVEN